MAPRASRQEGKEGKKAKPSVDAAKRSSAIATFARSLGATVLFKLTPHKMEELTIARRRLRIPATHWGNQYKDEPDVEVQVTEFDGARKLQGFVTLHPMVRLEVVDAQKELCEGEIWSGQEQFSKYIKADDARLKQEADLRDAERLQEADAEVIETESSSKASSPDGKPLHRVTAIYTHFEERVHIGTTEHTSRKQSDVGMGAKVTVAKYEYKCKLCQQVVKQDGAANGNLSKHLSAHHGEVFLSDVCSVSKHTSIQMRGGGPVAIYNTKEAFEMHLAWTVMCYMDMLPPTRANKQGTRNFAQSLDRKYAPPSPELTIQIIQIIQELIEEEQKALFAELRLTTGGTFLGECSDMMSNMGVSFVTLNGSVMIEDPKEGLRMLPFFGKHVYRSSNP